ncbi:MAG: tetratricopeptide repeat protein [Methylobacter sp.]
MAGYICIAMLEDPPYYMILATTEEEPENWLEELPLPSHLLCYESFKDTKTIIKQFIKRLKADGITAKVDKAFSALPHEVIRAFIEIRDEAVINNQLVKDIDDDDYDEGERLYDLACEYENGSNKIIPDLKKAFKLYMQSAELGYTYAYSALAIAYQYGDGVKKDLNESLKWRMRDIESGSIYGYFSAANFFIEVGMKEQASDMWRRCFKEKSTEIIQNQLLEYARHAARGSVEQVHTKKIAKLFGVVAEQNKDLAKGDTGYQGAIEWLLENQVVG